MPLIFRMCQLRAPTNLNNLSADPKGYLRPVGRKGCGQAARPTAATCVTCATPWQTCKSRPAPGTTNGIGQVLREAQRWTVPFATDFSGMDMAAYALDGVLFLGGLKGDSKLGLGHL